MLACRRSFRTSGRFLPAARAFRILWLICLLGGSVRAEEEVQVQVTSSPEEVRIGDLIQILLRAQHPEEIEVHLVDPPAQLGAFEVRSVRQEEPVSSDGTVTSAWSLTVATFETGTLTFPSLELETSQKGASPKSISSDPLEITVKSVLPKDAKDILDIKGPLEIPRAWWTYWPWALGAMLVLAALWMWRRRRRQASAGPGRTVPLLPPEEEALAALRKLADSGLVEAGRLGEFYLRLSVISRRYLGRRGNVVTLEATTGEIVAQLLKKDEAALASRARPLLQYCDLVKFARLEPPRDKAFSAIEEARDLVETGRPVPPAPETLSRKGAPQ